LSSVEFDESLWCTVESDVCKLLIGLCYRKPTSKPKNDEGLLEMLEKATHHPTVNHIVIMGDFNYPEIDYNNYCVSTGPGTAPYRFFKKTQDLYLFQNVNKVTRHRVGQESSTLDYVFTDEEGLVDVVSFDVPLGKSDHVCLVWDMAIAKQETAFNENRFNYWKGDYERISAELNMVDWEKLMDTNDIDKAWNGFENIVEELINKYVPKKRECKRRQKKEEWITKDTIKAMKNRGTKWRTYARCPTTGSYEEYRKERNKVNDRVRRDQEQYRKGILKSCKDNPKKFFAFMRKVQTVKSRVGQLTTPAGDLTRSDKEAADVLCAYFQTVFTKEPENMAGIGGGKREFEETEFDLNRISFDYSTVRQKLLKLNESKSPGPDGIHPMVLKRCADAMAVPLAIIYRKSFEAGKVPDSWKKAIIVPIYKKGSRKDASNYRPISLTSVPCKVMESIIKDSLTSFLTEKNWISEKQHGFVSGKSCLTNLLETFEAWTRLLDEGFGVDVIYLDYRKAFDSVSHRKLLDKIRMLGIPDKLVNWIQSFLADRKMRVGIGSDKSFWAEVLSGVPQGSVLGPLLFLIFVNDLPDWVYNDMLMFADDTKIWSKIRNLEDRRLLQEDLDRLMQWSKKWLLKFNPDKCMVMHIGHNMQTVYTLTDQGTVRQLEETSTERDLGVMVSRDLKPGLQCTKAAGKAMSVLRMISRNFKKVDIADFGILYKCFIRPQLEYCVQAWSPHLRKDIDCLETIQRRATKLVSSIRKRPYLERLSLLGLTTLETRRRRGDLIETYKILTGREKVDYQHFFQKALTDHDLRGNTMKLFKQRSRLDCRKYSFGQRIFTDWNSLPKDVVESTSVNAFKNHLDKYWSDRM